MAGNEELVLEISGYLSPDMITVSGHKEAIDMLIKAINNE